METLATLAMDIDVRSADPAEAKLNSLKTAARGVEEQFSRTGASVAQASAISGTAAGQAQRTMKGLVEVYGDAFNAQGRYTHSAEANAAMMIRNAQAQATLVKEQERAARSTEALERRAERLVSSYAPFEGAIRKANREMAEANKLHAAGVISTDQHAAAITALQARISGLSQAQSGVITSTKAFQQLTLNTGRQLTDIGVQLAGGQNILLILAQQLPQIADGFAVAKQQGLGLNAVLAGMAAQIAPLLPILGAIGVAAGVLFGGAALAARALNDDNKNLAASLGLTEKQMDRLKDKGVETGVTIGDVFKGTFNYIKGAVAPVLAPVAKFFDDLFDKITAGAMTAIKAVVGGFAGAFAGIKAIWSDLPAVMGDLFASGANLAISSIEKLLNFATGGINKLIDKANAVSTRVGGPQLGSLGEFSLGRVQNTNAGAATRAAADFVTAGSEAAKKAAAGVDKVFADIGKSITKAATDRIKKAAGDAEKGPKGRADPRDMSDERTAQIMAQIEQATAEELRSRLAITKEIGARAAIERQILAATVAAQQARVDAQIASIADDKGLSDLKKAALTIELNRVKFIQGMAADNQRQAIAERERADLAAEALAASQAGRQNQIDILNSTMGLATTAGQRLDIEERVRDLALQSVIAAQQAISVQNGATVAQEVAAKARVVALREIAANEKRAAYTMERAYGYTAGALDAAARAIESKDWFGATNALMDAFSLLQRALKDSALNVKIGALGGAAAATGGVVGGKAGSVLGGIGGGAAAGAQIGSVVPGVGTAIGAGVGAVIGGVGSLFGGGGSKKKRAREQEEARKREEEAQRLQNVADTKRSIEIATLEAQGQTLAAVALRREDELAALLKLDPSLVELQKGLYAAQDAADAAAKAAEKAAQVDARRTSIQDEIDKLTLSSAELLAKSRAAERAEAVALDPALGDLIDRLFGLQDAATVAAAEAEAAATAQADQARMAEYAAKMATEAYDRQIQAAKASADALGGVINKFVDLSKTLNDFADSLGVGELSGLTGQAAYAATKSRLMSAGGEATPDAIRAFLAASRDVSASDASYRMDVAFAEALARQRSVEATGMAGRIASMFAGLPGFANGGAMTIAGNPGVDQNVVSVNNVPVARVNMGETMSFTPAGGANDNSMAAAIRELAAEMRSANARLAKIEGNTEDTNGVLKNGVLTVAQET